MMPCILFFHFLKVSACYFYFRFRIIPRLRWANASKVGAAMTDPTPPLPELFFFEHFVTADMVELGRVFLDKNL